MADARLTVCLFRLASSLLGTAVVVAGKAASAAYSTAKDVYYTLQARNTVRTDMLSFPSLLHFVISASVLCFRRIFHRLVFSTQARLQAGVGGGAAALSFLPSYP